MRVFTVLVCGFVLAGSPAAAGAEPARRTPPFVDPPMQVHVVRSALAGCEPQCPEWIAAQGKIDAAALKQFKKVLSQLGDRKLPILVDSAGGSVNEALEIGRLVRAKGLDVVVTKTVLSPCAPADGACRKSRKGRPLLAMPQAHLSKCASSCAFVLAGGTRRFVGPWTFVGVHQFRSFQVYARILRVYQVRTRRAWGAPVETQKTLVSERRIAEKTVERKTPESTYTKAKQYFAEMGVGEGIMPLIMSAPSEKMHWLTPNELRSTRLATHCMHGEQLLAGAAAPPTGPVVTAPAPQVMGSLAFCEKFARP